MARVNKRGVNIANLERLLKAFDKKISVRVGIIGEKASQIHKGTDLTNAELGAVHEFGCTINVTDKMRNYLHSQGLHLKNDTKTIQIPARAFLRGSILSAQGRKNIAKRVEARAMKGDLEFSKDMQINKIAYQNFEHLDEILKIFADLVGFAAWEEVNHAFEDDKIKPPTTPASKQMRKYNKSAPTLVDTGDLKRSISYEVKEIK